MAQRPKNKMFSIRIPEKLLNDYRKFCSVNSIDMSKRIRKYMENDIEMWKKKKREQNKND